MDTTLGSEVPPPKGILEPVGGYLTKGNVQHTSPGMLRQEPDSAPKCTNPPNSPNLEKWELDRALICLDTSNPGTWATD